MRLLSAALVSLVLGVLTVWNTLPYVSIHGSGTVTIHSRNVTSSRREAGTRSEEPTSEEEMFQYRRQRDEEKNSDPYYYAHIPKTGGYGVRTLLNPDLKQAGLRPICGQGLKNVSQWSNWTANDPECIIHSSESIYSPRVKNTFTVVRSPLEHVLSQYFHCTESKSHKGKQHLMPSLDVWLEEWHKVLTQNASMKVVKGYNCYHPINLQSARLGNPANATEILKRFYVIGVLSQLERSTCLMTIQITGKVPKRCNCTARKRKTVQRKRRRLLADHGVQHHGASFQMTEYQTKLATELTTRDAVLYNTALGLFENHIRYVEHKYSFQMC